ncbi:DUF3219 family protein [Paenibacillus terreus]|uniref:DUF3219 family protein n=1 Tax=Paenibacillus terreus TaxID=1387834 RepID=A0ABV5BDA9_9BACL
MPQTDTHPIEVLLDHITIQALNFTARTLKDEVNGSERQLIGFDFIVAGPEQYHDITVHLYKQMFEVAVPSRQLKFTGTIHNYSTSIPKMTPGDDTVDFRLELIEKNA